MKRESKLLYIRCSNRLVAPGRQVILKEKLEQAMEMCKSYREVAKQLDTSHNNVLRYAKKYDIKIPQHFKHKKYERSIDKEFNYLTIRKVFTEKRGKFYRVYCTCDCICGKKGVKKRADAVIGGRVISCGCISTNRPSVTGEKNGSFRGIGELRSSNFIKITRAAKRRDIDFRVTKEYIWNLYSKQEGRCALSGIPIKFGRVYYTHETTASLDRIDSTKGYVEGNVQWVHKDVNKLKRNFVESYFIQLCKTIAEHQNQR